MSVTINCVLSGDLDNPRHRKVAAEISQAIRDVIAKQEGIRHFPDSLSSTETKTSYQRKTFDEVNETEMSNGGMNHTITINTGFHLNP
ncbi:MAG: hypothetical protein JWM44_1183 [Bacilli bacterium]|nr:hypothetical protein [Bacilli bacterium]